MMLCRMDEDSRAMNYTEIVPRDNSTNCDDANQTIVRVKVCVIFDVFAQCQLNSVLFYYIF